MDWKDEQEGAVDEPSFPSAVQAWTEEEKRWLDEMEVDDLDALDAMEVEVKAPATEQGASQSTGRQPVPVCTSSTQVGASVAPSMVPEPLLPRRLPTVEALTEEEQQWESERLQHGGSLDDDEKAGNGDGSTQQPPPFGWAASMAATRLPEPPMGQPVQMPPGPSSSGTSDTADELENTRRELEKLQLQRQSDKEVENLKRQLAEQQAAHEIKLLKAQHEAQMAIQQQTAAMQLQLQQAQEQQKQQEQLQAVQAEAEKARIEAEMRVKELEIERLKLQTPERAGKHEETPEARVQLGSAGNVPPSPYWRAPGKPPCKFGAACTRKNPQHFAEEDHPDDHPLLCSPVSPKPAVTPTPAATPTPVPPSPYGRAPGKPPCKYGAGCTQKNPQHFTDFDHPDAHPLLCGSTATLTPATTPTPVPPSPYKRAPGKPPCKFGAHCMRHNPQHFDEEDHPDSHPLLGSGGGYTATRPSSKAPFQAAPGKPPCRDGDKCARDSDAHFRQYDHPPTHPKLQNNRCAPCRARVHGIASVRTRLPPLKACGWRSVVVLAGFQATGIARKPSSRMTRCTCTPSTKAVTCSRRSRHA